MVLGTSVVSAFAASIEIQSKADEALTETTVYNYYKILDADIEDASKIKVNPETGEIDRNNFDLFENKKYGKFGKSEKRPLW